MATARTTALAAGIMIASVGPVAPSELGLTVVVSVTPAAAERLASDGEGITVSAWYYGDPRPGEEGRANQVGLIDLATADRSLGADGGTVTIAVDAPEALSWIEGPPMVNVNVGSARKGGADNILACDFFDGPLANARAAPVTLACGLISEGLETVAKS